MLKIVPRGELAFPMHKPKVEFDVALVQELHLQEGHPVGTTGAPGHGEGCWRFLGVQTLTCEICWHGSCKAELNLDW